MLQSMERSFTVFYHILKSPSLLSTPCRVVNLAAPRQMHRRTRLRASRALKTRLNMRTWRPCWRAACRKEGAGRPRCRASAHAPEQPPSEVSLINNCYNPHTASIGISSSFQRIETHFVVINAPGASSFSWSNCTCSLQANLSPALVFFIIAAWHHHEDVRLSTTWSRLNISKIPSSLKGYKPYI